MAYDIEKPQLMPFEFRKFCLSALFGLAAATILCGKGFAASSLSEDPAENTPVDPFYLIDRTAASLAGRMLGPDRPEWFNRVHYGYGFREELKPEFYLETVQPLYQDPERVSTVFIQPRVSYNATDADVYNAGLGFRRHLKDANVLVGANVFGDYQRDPGHGRVGAGAEILGPYMDARVNGYFRMTPRRAVESIDGGVIYEAAVNGVDAEIGGALPYLSFAKVYGGGSLFDLKKAEDNLYGWHARLELKPLRFAVLNLHWSDDNLAPSEWCADLRFNLDFDAPRPVIVAAEPYPRADARDRSLERVERQNRILKERYGVSNGVTFEIGRT